MRRRIAWLLLPLAAAVAGCGGASVHNQAPATTRVSPTPTVSPAPVWTAATLTDQNDLIAVSCPTAALCVAVDNGGNALISTNPTDGASSWTSVDVDGSNALNAVTCPSTTPCIAVDDSGQAIV